MMTRKRNDCAVSRCFYPIMMLLSAMAVVKGAWTESTLTSKFGFDYVSAAWSSSTTCVIVGNGASNGAILRTTTSGSSWFDVTQKTLPCLLNDIAQIQIDSKSYYLVTGSNNVNLASGGFIFTSSDGIAFSDASKVSPLGLNGVAIGSNRVAYVVGVGGNIFNSSFSSGWNTWKDITPKSNTKVTLSRRSYATLCRANISSSDFT